MKKLFLLFIVLLTGVTRLWATVSFVEGRPYTIKNSSGLYVNIETAGQNAKLSATFSVVYFTASGDNWTISNLTNSLYATSWNATANASNSTPWIIAEVSGKDNTYTLRQETSNYTGHLGFDNDSEGAKMYCNKSATKFVIEELDYAPTIPLAHGIRVGEKANSFTFASSASDNDNWYLITNRRKQNAGQQEDEAYNTPVYFAGAGNTLKRAETNINPAAITGNLVSTYIKHFVRFVRVGEGKYNLQFANGAFVNASLQGTYLQSEAGTYLFYNTTTEGTGFGWNLDDANKQIVDNNGQGAALAFWGNGTVTATSGNNVWSIYPVTFEPVVNVTYNLYESDGTTLVKSETVLQFKNSEVNIPSSFQSGYLASDYTYETTGTIGTTDCTITIVRTLKDNGNTPSLPGDAYLSVGDAATSMTAATSASDNDHWYLIMQNRGGTMTPLYDNETYGNIYRASTNHTTDKMNDAPLTNNEKYLVRFIEKGSGTGLYYMQFANGNYIAPASASRSNGVKLVSVKTINSAGTFAFYVCPDASTTFGWNIDSKASTSMTVDNNGIGGTVTLWGTGTSPSGSKLWTIYPVTLYIPSYFVQYEISDDSGVIYTSDDFPASNGDVITEVPNTVKRAFCNYTVTETTVTNPGTTTVPVTMTWSGPFNISASFETAEWKLLQMRQGGYNVKYVADASYYPIEAKGKMRTEDDAYLWAFIGNPYDGFEIVNKAAGSTMKLYAGATPANGTYPLMSTDNTTKWLVNGNPKNSEVGGFGLQVPGKSLYINDYRGAHKLSFWRGNTSTDAGSTLTIADQYPLLVENNISPYFNGIGGYFSLSASAENLITYGEKWMNAQTSCDKSTYDDLMDYVSDVSHIRYPATGYYRIKSSGLRSIGESYIGYGSSDYGTGLRTVAAANKLTDVSTVIRLTGSAGTYKISTEGLNVQSQTNAKKVFTATTDGGVDFVFTVSSSGVVTIRNDASASGSREGVLHEGQDGSSVKGVINWQASSDQSKWTVEEAESLTISLNSDGATTPTYYATFCAPFSYTVSDGTKAYTLKQSGEWLVPTEIEGEVAAGTPVLLKGSSATATLTIGSGYAESPLTTTALTGTYLPKTIAGSTDYVLGKKDGKVGFYHWSSNNLAANRAYLAAGSVAEGARGFALIFDDDATGIVSTPGEIEEGTVIYNLSGQRLNKMQKGINIVNGKKVLF